MALDIVLPHFTHDLQREAPELGRPVHFVCYFNDRDTYTMYSGVVERVIGSDDSRSVRLGQNTSTFVYGRKNPSKKNETMVLPLDFAPNCKWTYEMLPLKLMIQQALGTKVINDDGSINTGGKSRKVRKVRKSKRKSRRD